MIGDPRKHTIFCSLEMLIGVAIWVFELLQYIMLSSLMGKLLFILLIFRTVAHVPLFFFFFEKMYHCLEM